jgi:hypothetical protein
MLEGGQNLLICIFTFSLDCDCDVYESIVPLRILDLVWQGQGYLAQTSVKKVVLGQT